ncbi:MlaD family protein [Nocardia sp. CA2R105]|uniref:MlaD family protein n=1 Tax=Nocardia coffeae TaxID=2873381 RepID=UPI001CA6F26A|nr:MlaD family protein [Nocardia coffeae]MBY8856718.1 MlaD family protein [Nocardia coffeae]
MLAKILGSRGLMSAAVIVVLVLVAGVGLELTKSGPGERSYCADMPDSIGLYKDSAVTIMGVQVGKVTSIEPDGPAARVRFTVRSDRTLPPDVGAVTVSNTLIADRNLALIGAEPASGPGWSSGRCITKTLTPKSLSQTFDALAALSDQLDAAKDPAQRNAVGSGLDALDRATSGSGEQINSLVLQLSRALNSPDAAIGHIGKLLDDLTDLAHRAHNGWSNVQATLIPLAQTFSDINTLAFPPVIQMVAGLTDVLPQLNDVIMMFGTPALRALDSIPNLAQLISAGVGSLAEIIRMAPGIASGFAGAIDPVSGQFTIGYAPPKLALPQANTAQLCAATQTITGQRCQTAANGAVTVPSLPALLAAVSAK